MNLASIGNRPASAEEAATRMEKTSLGRRILVIDDNDDARGALCDRLSALGFEVAAESSGISGLARMAEDGGVAPFNGMLVELQMQTLGGMAVLQEMCDRFPSVPVIVMSDAHHLAKLRQAMKVGAKEYLVKPFDPELIRRKCLNIFLDGAHAGRSPDLGM
jgi:DNA-binding NtrC family response regulator